MTDVEQKMARARARIPSLLLEQMARIDWPRHRLDTYRQEGLRRALAHATERSPWHRERLAHIDPATFRLGALAELPVMTKADLIDHFDAISTDPRVTRARCEQHLERPRGSLLDDEFVVMASGGTTGVRAISATRLETVAAGFTAGLLRFTVRRRLRQAASRIPLPRPVSSALLRGMLRRRLGRASASPPTPPFMVTSAPGHHASSVVKSIVGGGQDRSASVVEPIDRIVAKLNRADPSHVIVYSSFIPHLVEEARAERLRIRPAILTPVAESFLPEHEAAVAEAWPACVIMSSWGATETGLLGAGSGFDSGMLLLDDMVAVEPVDAAGRAVPAGVTADKLLITHLVPHVLPLVRYELTDQLSVIDEPARCGSRFTRVSYVRGRQDDEFVYAGGVAVHAHTFRTVLSRERAIAEYQVEQTTSGADLRIVLAASASRIDPEGVGRRLEERLAHVGVIRPRVSVHVVQEIPRTEGASKLRRFLPLRATGSGTSVCPTSRAPSAQRRM